MIARFSSRTLWVRRFTQRSSPVLLDVAGFVATTYGVWLLARDWAWLVAGVLLILTAYRAQS